MTIIKDPDARLDYTWDWAGWLADGDTITAATITETTGEIAAEPPGHTATTVTVWITGGTAGTTARVTCRIATAHGRTDDRTLVLRIEHR